jgi:hypothetical protein
LIIHILYVTSVAGILVTLSSGTIPYENSRGMWHATSSPYDITARNTAQQTSITATESDIPQFYSYPFSENPDSSTSPGFGVFDTVSYSIDSFEKHFSAVGNPLYVENTGSDYHLPDLPPSEKRNIALGIGLLTVEYLTLPAIAYNTWWKEGFIWDNPLNYIDEKEPFLADNAWHLAGCNMLTEFHYRIMHDCFRSRHSVLLATSLTLFSFTAVECLDALEKTGKWEFSMGDVFANALGVGFWTFKHYYPDTPVSIRVGIRKWGDVLDLLEEAATAITDFSRFQAGDFDHYSILKVEGIYSFTPGLYCGVALSRKDLPSDENLWGVTVGWDLVKGLNKTGSRKSLLHTISEFVSIPISFTYWLD